VARTQITGDQVKDATIQRKDLDVTTTGQAVATKVVAGDNISISSTGVDSGTGDVTVSVTGLATVATGGALDDLSDVVITSATTNQVIKYDGSAWINSALPEASSSVAGIVTTGTQTFSGKKTHTTSSVSDTPLTITRPASANNYGLVVRDSSNMRLVGIGRDANYSGGHNYDSSVSPALIEIGSTRYGHVTLAYNETQGTLSILSKSSTNTLELVPEDGGYGLTKLTIVRAPSFTASVGKWNFNVLSGNSSAINFNAPTGVGINLGDADVLGGSFHVKSNASTRKGVIVQAHASQTANLLEVQNSSGTALFTIDKDGSVAAGTVPVARVSGLATVATSGDYTDLSNTPSIPSALDDLSDVVITSASIGQLIVHDGTQFVNSKTISSDLTINGLTIGRGLGNVDSNAAFGKSALGKSNSSGVNNVAVGAFAGFDLTSGADNVFIGWGAGASCTGGLGNVAIGKQANVSTGSAGAVAIGYGALASGDYGTALGANASAGAYCLNIKFGNATRISGDSSGQIGINEVAPGAQLQITSGAAARKGLIVKAAASQTANLLEVQDSADNAIFTVDPTGTLNIRNTAGSYLSIGLIDGIFSTLRIGRANGTKGSGYNLWIGDQAGFRYADNSGSGNNQNTGVGHLALRGSGVTTAMNGNANVALGYAAGQNVSGTFPNACFNTLIGASAAQTLTTGSSNIVIGWEADCGATANYQIALGVGAETTGADAVAIGRNASAAENCMDIRFGNASRITGDSSGNVAIANTLSAKQYTETSVNAFNTALSPSSGTLTVDVSSAGAVFGALDASVTTWAFTNVPTDNSKVITVTVVLDGNASYTYGDACSVNGSAITDGVMWQDGSPPASTDGMDMVTFVIAKDSAGTIKVFGYGTTNFS
jgi:hypothetical protein